MFQPSANCSRRSLGDLLEYILGQKKYSYLFDKDGTVNLQLRFSADGAIMSKTKNSVRGIFKIIPPRPSNRESAVSMLPEDEHTLFLYMGVYYGLCLYITDWINCLYHVYVCLSMCVHVCVCVCVLWLTRRKTPSYLLSITHTHTHTHTRADAYILTHEHKHALGCTHTHTEERKAITCSVIHGS